MVEHTPWVGDLYCKEGLNGQRLALIGHSHHNEWGKRPDDDDFTIDCIREVIGGEPYPFFPYIKNYFSFDSHKEFWERVLFMNYLPDCVTGGRFGYGNDAQLERAQARFLKVLAMRKPHKVIVFSNSPGKGWQTLPETVEWAESRTDPVLAPEFPKFRRGTYIVDGLTIKAFGLRHPQGASGELMRRAIQHILALPI